MNKGRHVHSHLALGRKKWLLLPLITLLIPTLFLFTRSKAKEESHTSSRSAQSRAQQRLEPYSAQAVAFSETKTVREIAKKKTVKSRPPEEGDGEDAETAENRAIKHVSADALKAASVEGGLKDGALASLPGPNVMATPNLTFEGLGRTENIAAGFGSLSPPDTNGYVGPNHYVQQDNLLVRVWNKTGTALTAPFKLSSLFTVANGGPGGICSTNDNGDPVVLYDEMADRWLLSQFAFTGTGTAPPFHQCIAISKTSDPTGAYYAYDFVTPGSEFPDYPHLGVWPDGYYMTANQFTEPGDIFNGTGCYSFNRTKLLAGDPAANYIYFNLNTTSFPEAIGGMLPSDLDGVTLPPLGRANTFAYFTTTDFSDPANGLRLFDFHSDFTTPANSTFTERPETTHAAPLAVAAFSVVTPTTNNGRSAVPQPGGSSTTGLDAITDRLMHRLQYRNFGAYETLVTTHTVGAPASTTYGTFRAAPRYYELRKTGAGSFVVQEQATFAPADGVSRWMGSAAEDNQGNLAVGYSVSDGTSTFPGIRYAGRLASDPAGSLAQGEATLIAGTGIQTSTGNRWGDYSALTLDPTDDCTFWYTTEYYTAAGQAASSAGWQTRIGSFKFPTCTAAAKGTAHFTVTNCASAANIQNAVVTIDGVNYGVSASNGSFDATLAPGSHTYSVTKVGSSTTTGNFNITNGNTTNVPVCLVASPLMIANGASITSDPNNNGAIDPGETVTVSFGVKNNGDGSTTSLVGTLQATGGVTSPGAPANYGVVASGGGTAAQPIAFTASNSLTCGSTLTATVHLQDGASDLGNVQYTFTICPIVTVTATAGTVGPTSYSTLKGAFDAINAGTHQGAITVSINASTDEGTTPATLNGSGAGSASYTSVLIRPINDGVAVVGNPASGFGVIQLNGASNVTIDGDNPNTGGTNRNLTVQNAASNTTTFTSSVRIALATTGATTANNDTIKNLNVLGSATGRNVSGATSSTGSENTAYGFLASSGATGATSAPAAVTSVSSTIGSPATATNLLVQNNTVNTAGRAISVQGAATTVFAGLQIKDNVIGNATSGNVNQVTSVGIMVNGTSNGLVSGNLLYTEGFVSTSTSGANQSISLGAISTATTATVEKNRVARVHNNATDTWPAIGINMGGGNNHVVQNNFVSDILNNQVAGFGGGGTTFGAYGIRANSGTGHKVYHNSVHLFGILPGTTSTDLTAAFMIVNTTQTGMDVRNNIFSNQQTGGNPVTTNTRHTVLFLPSGGTSAMNLTLNNNSYLQGSAASGALSLLAKVGTAAGTGEFLAANFNAGAITPATNLRSYTSTLSAAGTNDIASNAFAFNPPFVSNTDLHISAGTSSPLESAGATVGVVTDIDNQTRPGPPGSVNGGGTAPDMGADEFDGVVGAFPTPTPTPTPTATPTPTPGPCAPFSEAFDDITTLTGAGWVQKNQSSPVGSSAWFQGNPAVFVAHSGATNSYIGANFNSTTGTNTISDWLILPQMTLRDGDQFSFWTRTTDVAAQVFPDRLQVRMSTNLGSTNTGSTATDVGDFTNLMVDINPTYTDSYPHVWTQYTVTISGLGGTPTVGRLAFRYFVEGGGPTGNNSDYIGIDDVVYTCPAPPANIVVNDAKAAEPPSGSSPMLFTLTLTQPAPVGGLSVNYSTANGSAAGGGSCNGTADYVTASGTSTVPAGSQVATIPVTVCADSANGESDETLLLNISTPSSGTITDNQATGTITAANSAGSFLISELRTRGSAGPGDDFVELYNNSNSPLTVVASDASAGYGVYKMGTDCNASPVLIGTIPNGTVIPARGHYLMVGSAYSLANYGGAGAAAGNLTMTSDIEDDHNIAVFSTASVLNISSANRLDAVGFGTNTGGVCDLMREGTNPGAVGAMNIEYSFFRDMRLAAGGNPKDINDNSADFLFADTQGSLISGLTQRLGAPGPENLASALRRDTAGILLPILDSSFTSATAPNRFRNFANVIPVTAPSGTLDIRRRVQNTTGSTVTRLRFRIVDITTFPSPGAGTADLRVISSSPATISGILDAATCATTGTPPTVPCQVTVQTTTLETPAAQPNGGGYNSTVTVTLPGGGLPNNQSIDVNFQLGVVQAGSFRFLIIVEALP